MNIRYTFLCVRFWNFENVSTAQVSKQNSAVRFDWLISSVELRWVRSECFEPSPFCEVNDHHHRHSFCYIRTHKALNLYPVFPSFQLLWVLATVNKTTQPNRICELHNKCNIVTEIITEFTSECLDWRYLITPPSEGKHRNPFRKLGDFSVPG